MADARKILYGNAYDAQGSMSFSNFSLNGSTDQLEWIFQGEAGVTVTKLGIRLGTITGTTPTYIISLQGVDGSGIPDGTIKGGGSPASATFSPSGLGWAAGSWNWITLDNSYAIPDADTNLAIVVAYSSGTVDGSNFASFTSHAGVPDLGKPYAITNDAGSRSKVTASLPVYGYASSSKAYGFPISANSSHAFNSGTGTADEYGVKFTLPADWCATYKVLGVRLLTGGLVAAGSTLMQLYGGTDTTAAHSTGATSEATAHQSVTLDHDHMATTGATWMEALFDESTLATLYAGATYRIAFQPQNTNNFTVIYQSVATASDWAALNGGEDFGKTQRLNAGTWIDTATDRIAMELILADITEPAGGGGGLIVPGGFHGGMQR